MVSCAMIGCSLSQRVDAHYFRFPEDSVVRKTWINKCCRADKFKAENSRVCSRHFKPEDYTRRLKYELLNLPVPARLVNLKRNSVPSLCLPTSKSAGGDVASKRRKMRAERRLNTSIVREIMNNETKETIELVDTAPSSEHGQPNGSATSCDASAVVEAVLGAAPPAAKRRCCVASCTAGDSAWYWDGYSAGRPCYHALPASARYARQWRLFAGIPAAAALPKGTRMCSNHFTETAYERDLRHELLGTPRRWLLRWDALPSLLPAVGQSGTSPDTTACLPRFPSDPAQDARVASGTQVCQLHSGVTTERQDRVGQTVHPGSCAATSENIKLERELSSETVHHNNVGHALTAIKVEREDLTDEVYRSRDGSSIPISEVYVKEEVIDEDYHDQEVFDGFDDHKDDEVFKGIIGCRAGREDTTVCPSGCESTFNTCCDQNMNPEICISIVCEERPTMSPNPSNSVSASTDLHSIANNDAKRVDGSAAAANDDGFTCHIKLETDSVYVKEEPPITRDCIDFSSDTRDSSADARDLAATDARELTATDARDLTATDARDLTDMIARAPSCAGKVLSAGQNRVLLLRPDRSSSSLQNTGKRKSRDQGQTKYLILKSFHTLDTKKKKHQKKVDTKNNELDITKMEENFQAQKDFFDERIKLLRNRKRKMITKRFSLVKQTQSKLSTDTIKSFEQFSDGVASRLDRSWFIVNRQGEQVNVVGEHEKDGSQHTHRADQLVNRVEHNNVCGGETNGGNAQLNKKVLTFVHLGAGCNPRVLVSFTVSADLSVVVFHWNILLKCDQLKRLLGPESKCDTWTKFGGLLTGLLRIQHFPPLLIRQAVS